MKCSLGYCKQITTGGWFSLILLLCVTSEPIIIQCKQTKEVLPENVFLAKKQAFLGYAIKVEKQIKIAHSVGSLPLGGVMVNAGARIMGHTKEELDNAAVTYRFFKSNSWQRVIDNLGNRTTDSEYLHLVFDEFYNGNPQTFERLIGIMHRQMMRALGYPETTTIKQFKKIMDAKNKKGHYLNVRGNQFDVYMHMIALNLFIAYWYDTYIA